MPTPVHRREFDAFLSHAHVDGEFVQHLYEWLSRAGLRIFFDKTQVEAGADFSSALQRGIERSRGALLVASREAVKQGWVKREIDIAIDEHTRSPDFRVIPLRLEDAPVDELVRGVSWLDVPERQLTRETAAAILQAFYPSEKRPDPASSRDVYISASWRDADGASARAVSRYLRDQGFRLIGDSRDQEGFGDDRVERIIGSCGAFVGVIPFRDQCREARSDHAPYKYFLREADLAKALGLPSVVVADPSITRADGDERGWLRMATDRDELPPDVEDSLGRLWDDWEAAHEPHFIFLATDLDSDIADRHSAERRLLELVTGMRTTVGTEIEHDPIQRGIMESLTHARLVIADLSGHDDRSFNLDTSIEAGIAASAGTNLRLLARGETRRPPFMLRTVQMPTYADEVDRLAALHKIATRFRRRVINAEL